jgi:hypothetical protein
MRLQARNKKILYLGPLDPGGTCFSRLRALQMLHVDVWALDKNLVLGDTLTSQQRKLLLRFGISFHGVEITAYLEKAMVQRDCSILWIDKGDWLDPSILAYLKQKGFRIVQHTTDALFPKHIGLYFERRLMRANIGLCDVFLTTNRRDLAILCRRGLRNMRKTEMGFDGERFSPTFIGDGSFPEVKGNVKFIGHYEPRTHRLARLLADAGLTVHIFGDDWARRARHRRIICGPSLWGRAYVAAIRESVICLGFLSEWNYNECTVRSLEVPACGRLLLAPRTKVHCRMLKEGKEAEFFGSSRELVQKAMWFSENHAEAYRIGAAGAERVAKRWRWIDVMERDLRAMGLLN